MKITLSSHSVYQKVLAITSLNTYLSANRHTNLPRLLSDDNRDTLIPFINHELIVAVSSLEPSIEDIDMSSPENISILLSDNSLISRHISISTISTIEEIAANSIIAELTACSMPALSEKCRQRAESLSRKLCDLSNQANAESIPRSVR